MSGIARSVPPRPWGDASGAAQAADREADGGRGALWSYRRDFGRARLLVIDSRCGRVLTEGARRMVGDREFSWIEAQVEDGDYDHLLVATSMPWLLPRALHDIEAGDEALCAGPAAARRPVSPRRCGGPSTSSTGQPSMIRSSASPSSSGASAAGSTAGVHRPRSACCRATCTTPTSSEAMFGQRVASHVYQLTCSPFHNGIPLPMRFVFRIAWSRFADRLGGLLLRLCRAPKPSFGWRTVAGPFFGNHVPRSSSTAGRRSSRWTSRPSTGR